MIRLIEGNGNIAILKRVDIKKGIRHYSSLVLVVVWFLCMENGIKTFQLYHRVGIKSFRRAKNARYLAMPDARQDMRLYNEKELLSLQRSQGKWCR